MMTLAGYSVNGQICDLVLACTNQPDPHSAAVYSNLQRISDVKKKGSSCGKKESFTHSISHLQRSMSMGGGGGVKVKLETEAGTKILRLRL